MNNTTKYMICAVVAAAMLVSTLAGCMDRSQISADDGEDVFAGMNDAETTARRDETTTAAATDETETNSDTGKMTEAETEKTTEAETETDWLEYSQQQAASHIKTYGKVFTDAVIDDDFTENEVILILYSFANHKEYTPSDFSDVGCVSVREIYSARDDLSEPSRIILLTLDKNSKQNVLDAAAKLMERGDVYCAEPNYYSHDEPA